MTLLSPVSETSSASGDTYLRTYRRHRTIRVLAAGAFGVGEYALVYSAGLSDETRPFKLGLWDKSHNFAHGPLQI